ncbi:MAG: hypothetical protein NVSMB29_13860 [Candidatus Dormibacteria bacterium]
MIGGPAANRERGWALRLLLLLALAVAPVLLFGAGRLVASLRPHGPPRAITLPQPLDANRPPDLHGSATALDLVTRDLLLFGGYHTWMEQGTDETWAWDGQDWRRLRPATSPPPRRDALAVTDLVSRRVLLTGGLAGSAPTPLNDLWSWDGYTWTALSTSGDRPTPALPPVASWDIRDHALLLVCTANEPSGSEVQTWEWRSGSWTRLAPAAEPVLRGPALMSSDPTAGHSLLVAPGPSPGGPADAWSWDGTTWHQVASTPAGFSPLTAHMSSDGIVAGDVILVLQPATTWAWDGAHWHVVRASVMPPVHGALVTTLGSPILFGGRERDQELSVKFRWVDTAWLQLGLPVRGGDQVIGRRELGAAPTLPP